MTIIQSGFRSLAGASVRRPAASRAQQPSSNSFTEKLSEASAKVAAKPSAANASKIVAAQTSGAGRQEIDTLGRNFASQQQFAAASIAVASPFANPGGAASLTAHTSVDGGLGSTKASATGPTTATTPAGTSVTQTPEEIVSTLLAQNAPPSPYAPAGAGSTDPAVYRTDGYIKALNLNSFLQAANHDNQYRYDSYSNALHEWSQHGMQGQPPAPPKYETVDLNGFDKWWAQYTANIGQDAPKTTFMVNGPSNGSYGWSSPA